MWFEAWTCLASNSNLGYEVGQMQRHIWLLTIREGKEREYRRMHAAVWPELIAVAREAGLRR